MSEIVPIRQDGYDLLHEGAIALAQVEANGIRIDMENLQMTKRDLAMKMDDLRQELEQDEIWGMWRKRFGQKMNPGSRDQLSQVLQIDLDFEFEEETETGRVSMDEEVVQNFNNPFLTKWIRLEKYKKALGTYLSGIERELVETDGIWTLHPFFQLHTVRSFRSCVAKGTLIETVRDVSRFPKGIEIEKVRAGDYVYTYDDDLQLSIRKVLWSGVTGCRKVVRVHWRACGKVGFVDVTPEHLIRLSSGKYKQAQLLTGDHRTPEQHKHSAKISTLAMGRDGDRIWQTGRIDPLHDHRLVYSCLIGPLRKQEVVHHKDKNHLNNVPTNLQKMTKSEHSTFHALNGDGWTDEGRRKGLQVRSENHRLFGDRWLKGKSAANWLDLTKFQFLRMIASCGGKIVYLPHDFATMKKKAELLGIDLKAVKDRYDGDGNHIGIGRIRRLFDGTLISIVRDTKANYKKVERLLVRRGLKGVLTKPCANPFGRGGKPNNHFITKIEYLPDPVLVYDIEVEETHNFIANEICVHNSSQQPNFQNQPTRDKEIAEIIRSNFVPRSNCVLVENDFKGAEVVLSACVHRDPVFIDYITTPGKDMHRDMAAQIYCVDPKDVSKEMRYGAKNKFVFPQFYGDFYIACAKALWDWIDKGKLTGPGGIPLKRHLKEHGIKELGACDMEQKPRKGTFEKHLQEVEDDFWNNRFKVYGQWKRDWFKQYEKCGYFDLLSGFRISGNYKRNQVTNFPVQGPAFHCLLWSLIQVQKQIQDWKSLIVGQIHDSLIGDVRIDELTDYLTVVERVTMHDLPKHWPWLVVSPEIEYEMCLPGSNWFQKKSFKFKNGKFIHPKDETKTTRDAWLFLETLEQME